MSYILHAYEANVMRLCDQQYAIIMPDVRSKSDGQPAWSAAWNQTEH